MSHHPHAPAHIAGYLAATRETIDATFGEGHVAANPGLVAAFLQARAIETAVATARVAARVTDETPLKLEPRIFG